MVRASEAGQESAFKHNPQCRRWRHKLTVPCTGGIQGQTSLFELSEDSDADKKREIALELKNSYRVDSDSGIGVLRDPGDVSRDLQGRIFD